MTKLACKTQVLFVECGPQRRTRYPELDYQRQGTGNWRIIDTDGNAVVGAQYASEKELLADLDRYAGVFGCGH